MTRTNRRSSYAAVVFLLWGVGLAQAQSAPPLGTAQQFGVLGNSAVTGSTGSGTVVNGDVGSSPTSTITNFPPSRSAAPFSVHLVNDGIVQQAHADAISAYSALAIQGPGTVLPDNLATVGALTSGIYSFATGAPDLPASATLTLNGGGIFVFNVASSLTANVLSNVVGTANPCNIFWRVGSSATLNGNTFAGTVIANASITVGAGANVAGRVLAGTGATGAVTMAGSGGNTIGGCSAAPVVPSCPVISVAPNVLANGVVGTPYTQAITASGGTGPYLFTTFAPTLPAGLTLSTGGVLSGTPTAASPQTFTVQSTDSLGCAGVRTYTVTIVQSGEPPPAIPPTPSGCPTITLAPAALPGAVVGTAYSQTFTASGGTAPYVFTTAANDLPAGMALSSAGVLAGTPTNGTAQTFVVRGSDALGCFAERPFAFVFGVAVPTLPQVFVVGLGMLLMLLGVQRLRRRVAPTR
jgi:hypothetical protein